MASNWIETNLFTLSSDVSYGYTESATSEVVGPKFLRITDIQNGVVDWHSVPYCPIDKRKHEKYKLHQGDIVVARTGNSTGENYLFDSDTDAVYASYLIRFQIDQSKANPRFVWYTMRSLDWWAYVQSSKTGSAQAGANAKVLGGFPINLPPLPEQKAIAHILGSLDDKIELNRRMNETLEAMAQALFKSWFVDFDPVIDNALATGNEIPEELKERAEIREALGYPRKPLPKEIQDLFPSEFEHTEVMGWIPKGWKVGNLGNIANQKRQTVQPSSIPIDTPYIGLEHMPLRSISLSTWGSAENISSGKSSFATKDILFGKLRPYFHKVGIAPVDGVCSTDIVVITPLIPEWYSIILSITSSKAFVDYSMAGSTGTKMPRTNWKDMSAYKLCLPSLKIAGAYNRLLQHSIEKIIANIHESHNLSLIRDTLLPKLLSGEIRGSDVK